MNGCLGASWLPVSDNPCARKIFGEPGIGDVERGYPCREAASGTLVVEVAILGLWRGVECCRKVRDDCLGLRKSPSWRSGPDACCALSDYKYPAELRFGSILMIHLLVFEY